MTEVENIGMSVFLYLSILPNIFKSFDKVFYMVDSIKFVQLQTMTLGLNVHHDNILNIFENSPLQQ